MPRAVSVNNREQALRNVVFLHASAAALGPYVAVNGIVYCADYHAGLVGADEIGLNQPQRIAGRISLNETVAVEPFSPPDRVYVEIAVAVEPAGKLPAAVAVPLDAGAFGTAFAHRYAGQWLVRGQRLVCEYAGAYFSTTVLGGAAAGDSASNAAKGSEPVAAALLAATTQVAAASPLFRTAAAPRVFKADFDFEKLGVGGLDAEFSAIFRRAFVSRLAPPALIERLGIKHVKGLLLAGPPGCGKTLLARQIGKMLDAVEPVVVSGPEILNRYVGQSEENIRRLFAPAEADYASRGEAAALHIVIFDEIDAICKQRGGGSAGAGVNDSVVNQLLAKMDGVAAINNVLVIGMTNRLDLIDAALLRPGRFEIQTEIGLCDAAGRAQILHIHTAAMLAAGLLAADVDVAALADRTVNYSGAELAGLVRSATSFALARGVDAGALGRKNAAASDFANVRVARDDFERALAEVRPAFGAARDEFAASLPADLVFWDGFARAHAEGLVFARLIAAGSGRVPMTSLLVTGPRGAGKTVLAGLLATATDPAGRSLFGCTKLVANRRMLSMTEAEKVQLLVKTFADAGRTPLSCVVIDGLEHVLEFVPIGPRFSNLVLQTLLVLVKTPPPAGSRMLVIATTAVPRALESLGIVDSFGAVLDVGALAPAAATPVLAAAGLAGAELATAVAALPPAVTFQQLQLLLELARDEAGRVDVGVFGTRTKVDRASIE